MNGCVSRTVTTQLITGPVQLRFHCAGCSEKVEREITSRVNLCDESTKRTKRLIMSMVQGGGEELLVATTDKDISEHRIGLCHQNNSVFGSESRIW